MVCPLARAQNTANLYTGSGASLRTAVNWSLGVIPSVSHDAVLTTTGIKSLTGGNLTVGSFNVTASSGTFSIRNETITATNSQLTLGGAGDCGNSISGTPEDLLYMAIGSTLNIIGPNASGSGGGTGVLCLVLGQSGDFHIAGSCTISSVISDGGNHYGVHKTGGGTLTLSGVNSYSGNTMVSAGTLVLADKAGLKFVVSNGTSNQLGGTATAALNGVFTLDTSAVTASTGSWTLVALESLAGSFGSTFRIDGEEWNENANVWTRSENGRTWTFTEATGVLALSSPGTSAYDTWATTTHGLSVADAAFDADHDGDGIGNGLEWILGGSARTQSDTTCIRPEVSGGGSNGLTLVFRRDSASMAETSLAVEWGGGPASLSNSLIIGTADLPASGDEPSVLLDLPAAGMVTVHIPAAKAEGGKLFARLRAARN